MADLAIQSVFLVQLLEEGIPVSLIAVFAITVSSNATISAVMLFLPYDNVGRAQTFVDTWYVRLPASITDMI